ncbi:MAG: aminopeptidase P family protein [Desulfovibrionaceae bacterium]|nr:aminopeptidase P family protein [Desulfovibrionaceae bacterium]
MDSIFAKRRGALKEALCEAGFGALLISSPATRYYYSGFELHDPQPNESAGHLLIAANGDDWLCTDARYLDAARRLWDPERIFIYSAAPFTSMGEFFNGRFSKPVGFEAKTLSLAAWEGLSGALKGCELRRADGLADRFRLRKDEDEISRMRRSCALNQQMLEWLPSQWGGEPSETELAWAVERYFREHGASELAFASIVAYGPNAALPHAIPSPQVRVLPGGPLLADVGCRVDGYCSDQTRTFWIGEAPADHFRRALELTQEAQKRAIAVIRPGVRACDVYAAAWEYFAAHGVEKAFTHGLGHGVGLETHEGPSLNGRNTSPLEAGMIVTVEPGLYYPEWGGVRWEHMVLVTEDGAEIL